jgi:hypothetical protein
VNPRRLSFEAVFASLIGASAGIVIAGALMSLRMFVLDGGAGAAIHYAGACALAVLLGLPARWRGAARPTGVTVLMVLVLTFALRRWLTVWVNLEPLDWRSGPAGQAVGVVLPLEGWILGLVLGVDTALGEGARRPL